MKQQDSSWRLLSCGLFNLYLGGRWFAVHSPLFTLGEKETKVLQGIHMVLLYRTRLADRRIGTKKLECREQGVTPCLAVSIIYLVLSDLFLSSPVFSFSPHVFPDSMSLMKINVHEFLPFPRSNQQQCNHSVWDVRWQGIHYLLQKHCVC